MVGPSIEEAIAKKKGGATLHALATRGGMTTLERAALRWVEEGVTTLVEVERVVGSSKDNFEKEREEEQSGPARILVVDDDEDTRLKHRTILEKEGYIVEEAADGEEAVKMLQDDPAYSLLLLDLRMPGMGGESLHRSLVDSHPQMAERMLLTTGDTVSEESQRLDRSQDAPAGEARVFLSLTLALSQT